MLYSFFKSVSWEYAEAVFLDGGNDFTVFFKIMIPIAFPMVMTLFITGFIAQWNSYEAVLLYMPSFPTLAVGIYKVSGYFDNDRPLHYASMIISMIPVTIIFIAFSDVIMKNLSIGGLKG
jgi:raffinose/stachyose/melibiose transport system permease protein